MTTPKLPPPNRGVMIATLCGGGMKYEIAVQVFDQILADQLRSLQLETWQAAMEYAASLCEALRDEHCAGTQQSANPLDHCQPQGGDGCEFVHAWNDAASAIRSAPQPTTTQEA